MSRFKEIPVVGTIDSATGAVSGTPEGFGANAASFYFYRGEQIRETPDGKQTIVRLADGSVVNIPTVITRQELALFVYEQ